MFKPIVEKTQNFGLAYPLRNMKTLAQQEPITQEWT